MEINPPIRGPIPGIVIEIASASGINKSGKLRVSKSKTPGVKAIKLSTKPAIKVGSPIVKLKIVVAPNCNRIIGLKNIEPKRSKIGTTGFRNNTESPIIIDIVRSGKPIKAAKVGIPINNMKPKKSTKGIIKRRGRLSIRKIIILGNKVMKYVNNVIRIPGRAAS